MNNEEIIKNILLEKTNLNFNLKCLLEKNENFGEISFFTIYKYISENFHIIPKEKLLYLINNNLDIHQKSKFLRKNYYEKISNINDDIMYNLILLDIFIIRTYQFINLCVNSKRLENRIKNERNWNIEYLFLSKLEYIIPKTKKLNNNGIVFFNKIKKEINK